MSEIFIPRTMLGQESEQIAETKSKFTWYAALGVVVGSLTTGAITYFAFRASGAPRRWQPAAVVSAGTALLGGVSILAMRGALTSPEPIKPLALIWGLK